MFLISYEIGALNSFRSSQLLFLVSFENELVCVLGNIMFSHWNDF